MRPDWNHYIFYTSMKACSASLSALVSSPWALTVWYIEENKWRLLVHQDRDIQATTYYHHFFNVKQKMNSRGFYRDHWLRNNIIIMVKLCFSRSVYKTSGKQLQAGMISWHSDSIQGYVVCSFSNLWCLSCAFDVISVFHVLHVFCVSICMFLCLPCLSLLH